MAHYIASANEFTIPVKTGLGFTKVQVGFEIYSIHFLLFSFLRMHLDVYWQFQLGTAL
jgi:hypothetical protein